MSHSEIALKMYDHFLGLIEGDSIPINLIPPSLIGTVQDDPFDTLIASQLHEAFPTFAVYRTGSLTTPDVILRDKISGEMVGLEIKKLIQKPNGADPRGLTLDYNSCLPCGSTLIKLDGLAVQIPCYYLFCLLSNDSQRIVTLILMDGDCLNYDFNLHKEAKTANVSEYGHGPYGEGSVRRRAMYTYPNPLNSKLLFFHQRKILVVSEWTRRI